MNWIIKWWLGLVVFVIAVWVAFWVILAVFAFKGIHYVGQHGLKSVVNSVWEGSK